MNSEPTNYPLAWPRGYERTVHRTQAAFRSRGSGGNPLRLLTTAEAVDRVEKQISGFTKSGYPSRTRDLVISTNIQPTLSGRARSGLPEPSDPGVAVYFLLNGQPKVFCCDKWNRVADNLAAIAATIEALRGIERWGVAEDERVFAGFQALPAPGETQARTCWVVLGLQPETATQASIEKAWRELAQIHHPDKPSGSHDAMTELNTARDQALASLTQ